MKIDPTRSWAAVADRLAKTDNPRHRHLLQVLLDHLEAEATKDFARLLSTLSDDPQYHFWIADAGFDSGPKGLDAVTAHYTQLYEEGRNTVQYDIERIVVDDYCIVTEGEFHQVYPGSVLLARGLEVDDPASPYALSMRLVLFWPYDEEGKLIGEDSYSDGLMFTPERLTKLRPEDLPDSYIGSAA